MVAAGAALIGTCYGLARFAYGLFLPQFRLEFAIDSAVSGVIGAGSYVGYCAAIVLSIMLTPRLGPRPLALTAGLIATFGPHHCRASAHGNGPSGGNPPPRIQHWHRFPTPGRRGRRMGAHRRPRSRPALVNAGTGFGVLISGPVALVLLDQWRLAWTGLPSSQRS